LDYFNYLQGLAFEAKPDYVYCRSLFEQVIKDLNLVEDDQFDWIVHKKEMIDRRTAKEAEEKK
jgi:hypothetical protein